jgi:hypothetical protein
MHQSLSIWKIASACSIPVPLSRAGTPSNWSQPLDETTMGNISILFFPVNVGITFHPSKE